MGFKRDACGLCQVVDALAVFPARECQIIALRRFKSFDAVDGDLYFVGYSE